MLAEFAKAATLAGDRGELAEQWQHPHAHVVERLASPPIRAARPCRGRAQGRRSQPHGVRRASPEDRIIHLLLTQAAWWDQLTAEDHELLHALASAAWRVARLVGARHRRARAAALGGGADRADGTREPTAAALAALKLDDLRGLRRRASRTCACCSTVACSTRWRRASATWSRRSRPATRSRTRRVPSLSARPGAASCARASAAARQASSDANTALSRGFDRKCVGSAIIRLLIATASVTAAPPGPGHPRHGYHTERPPFPARTANDPSIGTHSVRAVTGLLFA